MKKHLFGKSMAMPVICLLLSCASCNKAPTTTAKFTLADKIDSAHSLNALDRNVMVFFQQFPQKSAFADNFFRFFTYNNFFQGGVIMIGFWWLWFLPRKEDEAKRRQQIILALASAFLAILIGRALVNVTPQRIRPLQNPLLSLTLPLGRSDSYTDRVSCFPSDHAVLFFSLATGMFMVSRKLGLLVGLYTTFFITLTRIYFCYHYTTDVIAGTLIGVLVTYVTMKSNIGKRIAASIYQFSLEKPQLFYPVLFIITYQMADLFEELRNSASFFVRLL